MPFGFPRHFLVVLSRRRQQHYNTGIKGLQRTLIMDGWSRKKRKYLAAAVLFVEGKPYPTGFHDNSSVKKDSRLAFNQLSD